MPLHVPQIESLRRTNPQLCEALRRLAEASLGPNQGWSLDDQITDGTDFARISSSALTTNKIDPAKAGVRMHGSLPLTFSGSFTYVLTTTTITWSGSGLQILRADGTTTNITNGSRAVSGLATGTSFTSKGPISAGLISIVRRAIKRGKLAAAFMNTGLIALSRTIAQRHSVDPALVCAVVEQESAWETHAIHYEPFFRTRYVVPLQFPPTEEVARSISWGLMQGMGQVAREHGFARKFLSELCEPNAGLEIGCAVLASRLASAQGDRARALALWNGGANEEYASQVFARAGKYAIVP